MFVDSMEVVKSMSMRKGVRIQQIRFFRIVCSENLSLFEFGLKSKTKSGAILYVVYKLTSWYYFQLC